MIKRRYIAGNWTSKEVQLLKKMNINIETGYGSFLVEEGENYNKILQNIDFKNGEKKDIITSAIFSESEINNSSFSSVLFTNIGYPQPQTAFKYIKSTFRTSCLEPNGCGFKGDQISSFRIKKEPKWKKNEAIFSLFWEYDSVFVKKDFYKLVFEPLNIPIKNVIINSSNKIAENVVQLDIPVSDTPLQIENSWYKDYVEQCSVCGKKRYVPVNGGFLPSFSKEIDFPIFKTQEVFGHGNNSFRKIIVKKTLLDRLHDYKAINKYNSQPMEGS